MKYFLFSFLLVTVLISAGCVSSSQNINITHIPTPAFPTATLEQTLFPTIATPLNQDPIIGSWLNGMDFYANGSVGTSGTLTWKKNENENNNTYFVIFEGQDPNLCCSKERITITTVWIYYPASDQIKKLDSAEFVNRGAGKVSWNPYAPTPVSTPYYSTVSEPQWGGSSRIEIESCLLLFSCEKLGYASGKEECYRKCGTTSYDATTYYPTQYATYSATPAPTQYPTYSATPAPTAIPSPVYTLPQVTPNDGRQYITPTVAPGDIVMKPR